MSRSAREVGVRRRHQRRDRRAVDGRRDLVVLRHRDVGRELLVLIGLASLALALSEWWRPAGQGAWSWSGAAIATSAVGVALVAGLSAVVLGRKARGRLAFYVAGVTLLVLGLSGVAVLDRGLLTVAYTATMLVAACAAFAAPGRWARGAVLGLLLTAAAVQLVRPEADVLDAATVFVLIAVGWFQGLLPRLGHAAAAARAQRLSLSDPLTGALNRRGLLEVLAWEVRAANEARRELSLLVVDLNGFKLINDRQGHAAGDELLRWVGATVPKVLPAGAAFGRLGGDEFAVVLPSLGREAAIGVGQAVRGALSERVGASIGAASSPDFAGSSETLLGAADAALYGAKADPIRRVQYSEAASATLVEGQGARRPAYTYQELVQAGGAPDDPGKAISRGRLMVGSFVAIALCGAPIVAASWVLGWSGVYADVLRLLGVPWILANFAIATWFRRVDGFSDPPLLIWFVSPVLILGGTGVGALASGAGAEAPIMGAFYLKLLFDAGLARPRLALINAATTGVIWLLVLSLGPAGALWVAPFQLVLLVVAHRLGTVGRAAFLEAKESWIRVASTDPLTALLNRRGFGDAAASVTDRAAAGELGFGVIVLDLDDFKSVNDRLGHAAGDDLLRDIARCCVATLGDALAVGRLGGDEFVALVPAVTPAQLAAQVAELERALARLARASIGGALHGPDGTDLERLLGVADARAYRIKQLRSQDAEPSVRDPE